MGGDYNGHRVTGCDNSKVPSFRIISYNFILLLHFLFAAVTDNLPLTSDRILNYFKLGIKV